MEVLLDVADCGLGLVGEFVGEMGRSLQAFIHVLLPHELVELSDALLKAEGSCTACSLDLCCTTWNRVTSTAPGPTDLLSFFSFVSSLPRYLFQTMCRLAIRPRNLLATHGG